MILLPNGCKCSELKVLPKNWKTLKRISSKWKIYYRFYDPNYPNKPQWGKLITIKGMNTLMTPDERRETTKILIDDEIYALTVEGYNPITQDYNGPDIENTYEIRPETVLLEALDQAYLKLELNYSTLQDIKRIKNLFKKSAVTLGYYKLKIEDIKRRHVRAILEHQAQVNNYSNDRYNKVRSYMMGVFKVLMELDTIEYNPIVGISKKKTAKKLREALTDDQVTTIKDHLKNNYYTFYRYAEIFFHSGARSTEMFKLQVKDVDLSNQTFKIWVEKGNRIRQEIRAINNEVLPLWKELLKDGHGKDFIFSKNLIPGPGKISERQISYRWKRHVKDKIEIIIEKYSNLNLDWLFSGRGNMIYSFGKEDVVNEPELHYELKPEDIIKYQKSHIVRIEKELKECQDNLFFKDGKVQRDA